MLVNVLTGVFDPPASAIAASWAYLLEVAALLTASRALITGGTLRRAAHNLLPVIRRL